MPRTIYNPTDEIPLRITSEAARAILGALREQESIKSRMALQAQSPKLASTHLAEALRLKGLAADLADSLRNPAEAMVGASMIAQRSVQIAADRAASK